MRFFNKCRTAEELKKEYRNKAKELHPDNGGNPETFKEMQAEFTAAWDRLKNIHVNKDGETYTKETTETAKEFMDIIENIINLDGVEVELCGSWIWASGNTKAHAGKLKELKFKWSGNKLAWYYHNGTYRKKSKHTMTMDEIRGMYGSQRFTKEHRDEPEYEAITA